MSDKQRKMVRELHAYLFGQDRGLGEWDIDFVGSISPDFDGTLNVADAAKLDAIWEKCFR